MINNSELLILLHRIPILILLILLNVSLVAYTQSSFEVIEYSGFFDTDHKSSSSLAGLIDTYKLSEDHTFKKRKASNRYDQYYKGIQIEGGEVVINPRGLAGRFFDIDQNLDPFNIHQYEAVDMALAELGLSVKELESVEVQRLIIPREDHIYSAYRVEILTYDPQSSVIYTVDAREGSILGSTPLLYRYYESIKAMSLYNDSVVIAAHRLPQGLSLSYQDLPFRTFDLQHSNSLIDPSEAISDSSGYMNVDAVQAHYSLGSVIEYFQLYHGRDSYDDRGTTVESYINYGDRLNEAYWYRGKLLLGGGDQVYYNDLVSVDITGHEFTHGVIDNTSDLVYAGESGALNESFADIFGEMAEYHVGGEVDWRSGKEIALTNRGSFRSFVDPKENSNPDTYMGVFWKDATCPTPRRYNDYCGVHTNSGVQNKWFYILANGEDGINDLGHEYYVSGISIVDAAAIAYKNMTEYLWSTADYHNARQGSILAAQELYGVDSPQEISTTNAWYAVGVGDPYESIQHVVIDSISSEVDSVSTEVDSVIIDTLMIDTILVSIPSPDTLLQSYFEEGWDDWYGLTDDSYWYSGYRSPEGNGSILLRDDTYKNMITSPIVDVSLTEEVIVSFDVYAWSVEIGENLLVEVKVDSMTWIPIKTYIKGVDFNNNRVSNLSLDLDTDHYKSLQFRLSLDASANTDHIYIDQFIVSTSRVLAAYRPIHDTSTGVWPNPASDIIYIDSASDLLSLRIIDMTGSLIYVIEDASTNNKVNIADWRSGQYVVIRQYHDRTIQSTFIKP